VVSDGLKRVVLPFDPHAIAEVAHAG